MALLYIRKAVAAAPGTESVHGGRRVKKIDGKWVPVAEIRRERRKEETFPASRVPSPKEAPRAARQVVDQMIADGEDNARIIVRDAADVLAGHRQQTLNHREATALYIYTQQKLEGNGRYGSSRKSIQDIMAEVAELVGETDH